MKKKTGEKGPTKLRQISVGVYLDAETSKRFALAVRKEQDKQIKTCVVNSISLVHQFTDYRPVLEFLLMMS